MTATILLSSGRVSTQSIYNAISNSEFSGVIEHEPIKAQYRPNVVLRNPRRANRLAKINIHVSNKLAEIDDLIARDQKYVSVGWTNYSWADHFLNRWGDKVTFAALVRCPYETSASLLTHKFFLGRTDLFARRAIINDSCNVFYKDLIEIYGTFTPLEKLLFHWVELYRYVIDFCNENDVKIWRFEDIRSNDEEWGKFIYALCGSKVDANSKDRTDRFKRKISVDVDFSVREELSLLCKDICTELGYSPDFVSGLDDKAEKLRAKYIA